MTLQQFADLSASEIGTNRPITITPSNIDDVFRIAFKYGIKELEVTNEQMNTIVLFYLTYAKADPNGEQARVIKEGVIDKYFGVNLILCTNTTSS